MKKILTMLFLLAIVTGSVFATEEYLTGSVNLKVTVPVADPKFSFMAALSDNGIVPEHGSYQAVGSTIAVPYASLLNETTTVYCKVTQNALTRYKGKVKVTYSATAFEPSFTVGASADSYKVSPSGIGMVSHYQDTLSTGETRTFTADPENKAGYTTGEPFVVIFTYGDENVSTTIPENTDLQVVCITWNKNKDLPAGEYSASVSVRIESV